MNELPLTFNGKIDLKALPEPAVSAPREYSAPAGELEEKLVEIWSVILKVRKEAISVKKSFFELGGDSIKIMRLNSMINERLQVQVSIPDLFRYTSVKALAGHILNGNAKMNDDNREVVHEIEEIQSTLSKLIDASE
jgi:acyl carrier protein